MLSQVFLAGETLQRASIPLRAGIPPAGSMSILHQPAETGSSRNKELLCLNTITPSCLVTSIIMEFVRTWNVGGNGASVEHV